MQCRGELVNYGRRFGTWIVGLHESRIDDGTLGFVRGNASGAFSSKRDDSGCNGSTRETGADDQTSWSGFQTITRLANQRAGEC
jgi:hypothetical protein